MENRLRDTVLSMGVQTDDPLEAQIDKYKWFE
jgi:hypothetical protein